jgi:ABC-2 type transport system ATP-binding protein
MSFVMEATGLGRRYGRRWALRDCTLAIPPGRVVGLVGPNGAGKTTLLHLAVGLLAPTSGSIRVLGANPADGPVQLGRVGFVAQDTPVYARLTVAQHLRMGAWLNPSWDREIAKGRIEQLGLDLRQRAGTLSGGQRAQLALTLAVAKRPECLILDEPLASLDPACAARVPSQPHGNCRRATDQRRALLPPDRRPGEGLRLPGRARRLQGAGCRRGQRAAFIAPPA